MLARALLVAAVVSALAGTPGRAATVVDAAWLDQAPYPVLAPGERTDYVIRLRNTGRVAWDRRDPERTVVLGIPNDDPGYADVGMADGWLARTRVAGTREVVVAPGGTGTFVFGLRALGAPGTYRIPLRPLIDGIGWLDDDGIYVDLTVAPTPLASGPLTRALDETVARHVGDAGIVVVDAATGYRYEHSATRSFAGASLYKVEVLVALYAYAAEHPGLLEGMVPVDGAQRIAKGADASRTLPVRQGIEDMITVSDNDAAFAFTELLGADFVNTRMRALGLTDTSIDAVTRGARNATTALDQARLLDAILTDAAGTAEDSAEMRSVLLRQRINDRISTGLPGDARFAHKTGNTGHTYHDAGILWTPHGVRIVVILTDGPTADLSLMRDIGRAAFWLPAEASSSRPAAAR